MELPAVVAVGSPDAVVAVGPGVGVDATGVETAGAVVVGAGAPLVGVVGGAVVAVGVLAVVGGGAGAVVEPPPCDSGSQYCELLADPVHELATLAAGTARTTRPSSAQHTTVARRRRLIGPSIASLARGGAEAVRPPRVGGPTAASRAGHDTLQIAVLQDLLQDEDLRTDDRRPVLGCSPPHR